MIKVFLITRRNDFTNISLLNYTFLEENQELIHSVLKKSQLVGFIKFKSGEFGFKYKEDDAVIETTETGLMFYNKDYFELLTLDKTLVFIIKRFIDKDIEIFTDPNYELFLLRSENIKSVGFKESYFNTKISPTNYNYNKVDFFKVLNIAIKNKNLKENTIDLFKKVDKKLGIKYVFFNGVEVNETTLQELFIVENDKRMMLPNIFIFNLRVDKEKLKEALKSLEPEIKVVKLVNKFDIFQDNEIELVMETDVNTGFLKIIKNILSGNNERAIFSLVPESDKSVYNFINIILKNKSDQMYYSVKASFKELIEGIGSGYFSISFILESKAVILSIDPSKYLWYSKINKELLYEWKKIKFEKKSGNDPDLCLYLVVVKKLRPAGNRIDKSIMKKFYNHIYMSRAYFNNYETFIRKLNNFIEVNKKALRKYPNLLKQMECLIKFYKFLIKNNFDIYLPVFDIHDDNIMVDENGRYWIIDPLYFNEAWDGLYGNCV